MTNLMTTPLADGLPSSDIAHRECEIATLKQARQQIAELRQTLDRYEFLSQEAGSLSRKVDEQLAWLLLRRELEDEGGA